MDIAQKVDGGLEAGTGRHIAPLDLPGWESAGPYRPLPPGCSEIFHDAVPAPADMLPRHEW